MRGGRAYAPGVCAETGEGPVQHARQPVDQVAAAEEVSALRADRKAAVSLRIKDRLKPVRRAGRAGRCQVCLLRVVVVIEDDPPPRQFVQVGGVTGHARRRVFGELPGPTALIQLDLAKAREFEVLRDSQRVREGHEHAFARLVEGVDVADNRQADDRRGDFGEVVAGVRDDD